MDKKQTSWRPTQGVILDRSFAPVADPAKSFAACADELIAIARAMNPDDLGFDVDLPAGKMHFRAYRRHRD